MIERAPMTPTDPQAISVLFVDDEQNVRSGLQRMLRGMRSSWNMRFAGSGNEALEMMHALPADVIVSDMRMPGMDGRELLARIEQGFPNTVRIILSGQCDRETSLRTAGKTHIFLSKPCETDDLIDAINRACRLRARNKETRDAIAHAGLRDLPEPPPIYLDLIEALEAPTSSGETLARTLAKDQTVATKLLEFVNATPLVGSRVLTSPVEAFGFLGPEFLQPFVLQSCLAIELDDDLCPGGIAHCLLAAVVSRQIARDLSLDRHDIPSAFAAGLLHDVGAWVMLSRSRERYTRIVELAPQGNDQRRALERREFGATHADIGACLLELWGLSHAVIEAVAFHHEPALSGAKAASVVGAVHVGTAIADRLENGTVAVDRAYLAASRMLERIDGWCGIAIAPGPQIE